MDGLGVGPVAPVFQFGQFCSCGKRAFYDQIDLGETGAYDLTKGVMVSNSQEADAQEGMSAFLEKREPTWQDD
jgi:1,4-dihydroxy-2-naphthoyl-CoA synthase